MTQTTTDAFAIRFLPLALSLGAAALAGRPLFAADATPPDADLAALKEAGIEPDAAGLGGYLDRFVPSDAQTRKVAALVEQLGAETWQKREEATKALAALPVLPRAALERAAESDDPEVRVRAGKLLKQQPEDRSHLLSAALGAIAKRDIKGLAGRLLAAAPHCTEAQENIRLQEALRATAGRCTGATPGTSCWPVGRCSPTWTTRSPRTRLRGAPPWLRKIWAPPTPICAPSWGI